MSTEVKYVQGLEIVTEELPSMQFDEEIPGDLADTLAPVDLSDVSSLLDFGMNLSAKREPKPPRKPWPAVDTGALLSFVVGVTPQEREDALYSVQLAARGASALFDRCKETEAWYGKYIEILGNLGWSSEPFAFSKHAQTDGELHMDQAALAVLAAIATEDQLAVLKQSLDVLKGLPEDHGTVRLFDFHATAQSGGNFQIGAVQKSEDGVLSMVLGAFLFQSEAAHRHFLFSPWDESSVQFWAAAQKMTFNAKHYARLLDAVEDKLGVAAEFYIADLEIA